MCEPNIVNPVVKIRPHPAAHPHQPLIGKYARLVAVVSQTPCHLEKPLLARLRYFKYLWQSKCSDNALNRLKNTLPLRTKESLYCAFILLYFDYCNQVWHHCRKRNTAKIEKVNEKALRYIFNDKSASYQDLLERIRLPSLETRRIQDMLLTINNTISDKAPPAIRDLITLHVRSSKYNL